MCLLAADSSDGVTVRHSGAGSYRRVFIVVLFRQMFRVYACTGTVFRQAFLWAFVLSVRLRYTVYVAAPSASHVFQILLICLT